MATTIIVPEIFANAVNEKLGTSLRIGRVAYNATAEVGEIRQAGDTVHFPQIARFTDATEVTKGTAIVPETIDMTDTTATIKHVAKGGRVYDKENIQIKGGAMDRIIEQVATAMSKKIDGDLVDEMDASAAFKEATTAADKITSTELQAGISNFGDDIDTDSFAGIIINSKLVPSFIAMDEFVSTSKTYQTDGNGVVRDGVLGYYLNIPVIVCNNKTYDSTASECKTYIVKKNSLGYIFQKDITVEEEREAKLFATDIIASSLYAVKLLDLKGCVILRKTIASE